MLREEGIHAIGREECLRLLAGASVGRIVYTINALPAVLPVNFSYDGGVVIRTDSRSSLSRAVDHTVVAFETDHVDEYTHTGWSVVIVGRAAVIRDPVEVERLLVTGPRPWVPGPRDTFLRIKTELVTGRLLGPVKSPQESHVSHH